MAEVIGVIMATPQDPQAAAAAIDQIASQRMGVQPQVPQQAAPAPAPKDSAEDQASAKGSPDTEADKMDAEAVTYDINGKQLSAKQISSTMDRYAALNHKHMQMSPIFNLAEKVMKANPNASSKQVADKIDALIKGQSSNPTLGNTKGEASGDAPPAEDMDAMMSKWEKDNAATLPPMYKEMMSGANGQGQTMATMQQQLAQTQQMLQQVMAQSAGVADAAKQGMNQAESTQVSAIQKSIANNVDRVQQHLQLPDEQAESFMAFAAERGFTMEDFIDPQLTLKVMTDFKNNLNSPEMERIMNIAKRRQAMTGSFGSTPTAGPAGETPQSSRFDDFASKAMSNKGLS